MIYIYIVKQSKYLLIRSITLYITYNSKVTTAYLWTLREMKRLFYATSYCYVSTIAVSNYANCSTGSVSQLAQRYIYAAFDP